MLRVAPALLAVALGAAPASASTAPMRGECALAGSSTVAKTPQLRVFTKRAQRSRLRDGRTLFGCLRASGRTRVVYRPGSLVPNVIGGVGLVRAAGSRVAFTESSLCTVCGDGGPYSTISEVDVRSGSRRWLRRVRAPSGDQEMNGGAGSRVDALVLDACGNVAYRAVAAGVYRRVDPDPQLHLWTPTARRLVDGGPILRRSIRLSAWMLSWIRDGKRRTSPLEPACVRSPTRPPGAGASRARGARR